MPESSKNFFPSLGFLRLSLLGLVAIDILLPLADMLTRSASGQGEAWASVPTLISSVMAPILFVVLLFESVMSRVRAADCEGEQRAVFMAVFRVELLAMAILVVFWVQFFWRMYDG